MNKPMKRNICSKRIGLFILLIVPLWNMTAQNNLIPNTQDCSSTRPAFAFSIREAWVSSTAKTIDTRHTPLVGDIDDDGNVEVFSDNGLAGGGGVLYVFEGKTGAYAGQLDCPGIGGNGTSYNTPYAIFKRNDSAKGTVFIAGENDSIYLYEVRDATRPLQFDLVWKQRLTVGRVIPVVSDLNGDGNVEIIAGKYIIDANTGSLLSTLAVGSGNAGNTALGQNFPLVADVDGDGLPDVIVGTCVYRFNAGFVATPTPWSICPRYGNAQEGLNIAADIDQDGNVDIVFVKGNTGTCDVTVWTPLTNTEVGQFSFPQCHTISYPFVGDIDGIVTGGKKYPEIVINTCSELRAFSYTGSVFTLKWLMPHSDASGSTALTLFDFNLDGVVELIYRDQTHLKIFDGSGVAPIMVYQRPCGSATIVETPIVADVTGDGSANIIVTGDPDGTDNTYRGEVMVFEGSASKWASCPKVWNQQLYSNLLVNEDLTIPTSVQQVNLTFTLPDNSQVQYYNGGPMQAPYISEDTYLPIDLSPDIYIVNGSITINSSTSVTISVEIGNQGLALASSTIPIRYYENSIIPGNLISSASTTLGVDLLPGQTTTVTQTITVSSGWVALYVRALDDGINFPAIGAFSDCDLTNNTKSFGTLELTKEIDQLTSCLNNIREFTVKLKNDGNTTYNNIELTDSLSAGWIFISATPSAGTSVSSYNPVNRSFEWTIPILAPGDSAVLTILAQVVASGSLRNFSWVETVDGTAVERDYKSAYVIASANPAPTAPSLSPSDTVYICPPSASVLLTASGSGVSYQWYKDGTLISGATTNTYLATADGIYYATLFDGTCTSNRSDTVTVIFGNILLANDDYAAIIGNDSIRLPILDNDSLGCCNISGLTVLAVVSGENVKHGTATFSGDTLIYTPFAGYNGIDSMIYYIKCGADSSAAKVFINVTAYPDNIIDTIGCVVPFNPIAFSIRRKWYSANNTANNFSGPLVGDLDGDGIPEIVTTAAALNAMNVLNGSTGALRTSIPLPVVQANTGGWVPVSTSVLVDSDKNGMGEIIIAANNNTLTSYEADTTGGFLSFNVKWATTFASPSGGSADNMPQPIVADFNGDGVPEVVVFNQIFNARTGVQLGVTEAIGNAYVGRITNRGGNNKSNFLTAVDFDDDGLPEIVAGGKIYKVNINTAGTSATCTILYQTAAFGDGFTSVADVNLDGHPDVVVVDYTGALTRLNIWSPKTNQVIQQITIPNSDAYQGYAFIGDIDGVVASDGKRYPEICVTTRRTTPAPIVGRVSAYRYNPATQTYSLKWDLINTDTSGGTGITLFDFNNDGINELVYRDEQLLYILDGRADGVSPTIRAQFVCTSGTAFEYPVIADLDGSGSANICVTCRTNDVAGVTETLNAFESATTPWAPTRKVWNQVNYEVTGINNDLTVPIRFFPKHYRFDIGVNSYWPYNGALIQVPIVDTDLKPVVRSADPFVVSMSSAYLNDVTIRVSVVIGNQGVMNVNPSLPVSLYQDYITPAGLFETRPIGVALGPGQTVTLNFDIPLAQVRSLVYVRLQDDGVTYPAPGSYNDCDYSNNTLFSITGKRMVKDAVLNAMQHNGTLSNPVAVFFRDTVEYTIKAINASPIAGEVFIRDTLPAWLDYLSSVPVATNMPVGANPSRNELTWQFLNAPALDTVVVTFRATPYAGVSASQPLFVNRAWVTLNNTFTIPTNYTYHQGTGISVVTFSAGYGGTIYHATEQILDYQTSPQTGIVIVPDEGYRFAGWSHTDYLSLRGETIKAQKGIMHYETLTIYGNVNLHAVFEPEVYPIIYYLNGGVNAPDNPSEYNIISEVITLNAPQKTGDVFTGWTGSNSDEPQQTVTIPTHSIGERVYYANFLYSGRIRETYPEDKTETDRIWTGKNELFVRTTSAGGILRIYSLDGVLRKQLLILQPGESTYKLPGGFYIVTINNSIGQVVRIE